MKSIKMRGICAAVTGALLFGFGANAMADATTDAVKGLVDGGMLTPEAADVVNRGHDKDVAAVKAAPKSSIDFLNDDAPLSTGFHIGSHEGTFKVYGVIDETFVDQNHGLGFDTALPNPAYPWTSGSPASGPAAAISTANPNVKNQSGFPGNGLQNSRIGIEGAINLVGSTKLMFNVETGFNPVTGEITNAAKALAQCSGPAEGVAATSCKNFAADSSINGGLGNRAAYFGLVDDKLGKLTFGFQNSIGKDVIGAADPVKSDSFSPLGESGKVGGGGGVSPDARWANSFKYVNKYDTGYGVVNGAAMYQIGNDLGDTSHGYAWGVGLGYHNKDWWNLDVQTGYTYGNDQYKGYESDVYNQIALRMMNINENFTTVSIKPTEYLKLSGGYNWYMNSTPTDTYFNPGSAWGYVVNTDSNCNGGSSSSSSHCSNLGGASKYHIGFVGGELDIGKLYPTLDGLKLQAGLYDYTMQSTNAGADNKTGQDIDMYTESLVLDYRFNKRFDTYLAFTNNKLVGIGTNAAVNYTDIKAYGAGLRMAF